MRCPTCTAEMRRRDSDWKCPECRTTAPLPEVSAPEVRMSPGYGDIVVRWAADHSWQLVGGTNDGELLADAEVADWTPLILAPVTAGCTGDERDECTSCACPEGSPGHSIGCHALTHQPAPLPAEGTDAVVPDLMDNLRRSLGLPKRTALAAAESTDELREAERRGYERGRRDFQFAPEGDNHHNAALCPYCSPERGTLLAKVQAVEALAVELRGAGYEAAADAVRHVLDGTG